MKTLTTILKELSIIRKELQNILNILECHNFVPEDSDRKHSAKLPKGNLSCKNV